jgi:tetraacyldisaccharide 4'-kinase
MSFASATPSPYMSVPGFVFEAIVRAHNQLYAGGWLRPSRLPRPVISIGNLTLGGTGKTPLAIYLAELLGKLNAAPALLSRGYGRHSRDKVQVFGPEDEVSDLVRRAGDEPALVRRRVPAIWLGISNDRRAAGERVLEQRPDAVFILDDGFQHRKLHRDLDIVMVDRAQPLSANRVFPRGTLREPLTGLERAQVVLINGRHQGSETDPIEASVSEINPRAQILHCVQRVDALIPYECWSGPRMAANNSNPGSAFLVAAVGNPERFRNDIEALGVRIVGTRFFRDHQSLSPRTLFQCANEARSSRAEAVITTEKDAVKLSEAPEFPLLVSVQSTRMHEPEVFQRMVGTLIESSNETH